MKTDNTDNKPWFWIPLLNFASGFPYIIITSVSVLMYKKLGINNEDIGVWTSLLSLPWVLKPLWSPFIDLHGTKRKWFLGKETNTIDISHTNKYISSDQIQHIEVVPKKPFYDTTLFKFTAGFILGVAVTK